LSTDLGQPDTPPPVEGMRLYADALRSLGFSHDDLHSMMAANPCALLGIGPLTGSLAAAEAQSAQTAGPEF
ncbi:MAG TPA: hypothetical protein VH369_15890, partial [Bryobacteraceae bacterium]